MDFDTKYWSERIKQPDWYFEMAELYRNRHKMMRDADPAQWKAYKQEVFDFFTEKLIAGEIALGTTGKDFDVERKPIDYVVIHHTDISPGLTQDALSALTLIRLYASYYAAPYDDRDVSVKGQPIYSGHFRGDKQIFWPYHWIVRGDGTEERLLLDSEVGWHAGDWQMNCRSVGIVLDNDYMKGRPSEAEIRGVADIIKKNYPDVPKDHIIGHKEVRSDRTCPGELFLSTPTQKGWKDQILDLLQ